MRNLYESCLLSLLMVMNQKIQCNRNYEEKMIYVFELNEALYATLLISHQATFFQAQNMIFILSTITKVLRSSLTTSFK